MLLSLSHFLMGERSKREGKAQNAFLRSHDALTGCLNWERYNDYLVAFSNDVSSSLGVLRADVNQLAELNQRRGKEAGDRMVCHVAQVLRRRFGPGNVYRINGDEFVVFRTDVTYRKFAGDVEACQQLLEEQAPGAVAFGWTWADQDIQIQGMVHHAGEALQLEKQRHGKGKGAWGQQAFWGLEEAFAKGHFHIYLQPKAEIASGRIRGAEPLSGTGMTNTGWWDRISSSPSWSGRGLFVTSTCLYWRRSAGPSAGGGSRGWSPSPSP